MSAREFRDKIVFVTGATSGIGRYVAIAFAREGARVVGSGRNAERGDESQRLAEAAGGSFSFVPMDLAEEDQIIAAVRTVMDRYNRLDCAVNCAGIDPAERLLDYTAADFDRIFDTNVRGLFLCVREEVKAMHRGGGGAIVNLGSIAGQRAFRGNSLYNASKAAAKMLTQSAAVECAEFGVRVNEVQPGPVMTPMLAGYIESSKKTNSLLTEESLTAAMPLGRLLTPEDIASSVLFLCSANAANITGASLVVDGGF